MSPGERNQKLCVTRLGAFADGMPWEYRRAQPIL
jgi:hypothetical protein